MKKKYRYQDENGQWVKGFYDEKEIEDLMSYGYKPEEVKEYYNPNDEDADNPYYDISENEVADFMQVYPQAMLKSDYEAQLKKKEQEEREERGRRESQRQYERSSQRTTLQTNINQISLNQAEITKLVVRSKQPGVSPQEKAQIKAQVNALTQQNKSLLESIKPYDEDAYNYGTAAQDQTIQYFDSDWDVNYTQNFWNGYEKQLNYKLDKAGKKAGIKTGTMASDYTERSEADRGLGELDKIHSQVINLISEVKQKSSAGMDANSIKSIYGPKFDKLILDAETFASKLNPVLEEGDKWRINGIVDSIRWYKNNVIGGGDSPGEIFTSKNFDFYIESSKQANNWYNQSRKQLGEKVGIVKGSSKPIESTSPEDLQLLVGDINQYRLSASRFKALTAEDLRGYSPEDIEAVNAAMEEAGYGGNPLTEVLDPNYDANKALIAANKTRRGIGANKVVKAAVDDYFDYQMQINPEMAKKQKATYEAYSKMTDLNAYQQGQKLEFERKAVDYATKALVLDLDRQKNVIDVLNESFTGIDFQAFSSGIAVISKREKEIKSQIDAINKKMQPLVSEFESHKTQVEKEMERLNKLYEEGGIADGMYQSLFNDLQSSLTQKQKELESKIKEITGGVDYQSEINKLNKEKSDLAIKTGVNENVYKLSEQAATEYQNYEALRSKLGNLEYMMQDWDSQYPDYKKELEQNKKIAEFRALGSESELGKALDDAPFWKQALYYGYKYLTPAGLFMETEIGRGFSKAVGSGILGLTQVPEVFYSTFGGDSYTWTTELYDWFQDFSFLRQGEFGDYSSYGYEQSSLDYLTYMGGNVMGSLSLFASGGLLGGTTKLGQTAATFSTSYLTSLGDTYTEMLDVAESNNMSPQWAALQSQAITVVLSAVESMIPDIKYFEPSAARKSILQAIRSGKTVKEAVRGTIEALPDAANAYLKSGGKEGLEEWAAKLVDDTYRSSYNALSGIQYFNDTWNPSEHLKSILGGVIGGVGGNFFSRPKGATTDIKVAMYEAAENGQSIIDNAKNEKQKNKLQADMKAPMESFSQLSSHANWEILDKQDRVEAFFLSQQINDIQKKVEENKKNGIQDKASEDKLKEYQDGLNTILNSVTAEQAQGYQQHKQNVNFIVTNIGTEADFGVIEDSDAFKSLNESGQEAITQIRQQMMEVAKTIDETGSEDATNTYAILQKMAGDILNNPGAYKNGDYPWRIVEDTDNEIPMLEDKRGQYISSRMHDLITEDVNRDQAQQIAREEWLKTDDGKRYLLLTQNKDDQKNRKGIPSEEQQGQESVQARSVERTSTEETPAGGVVQGAQEEVTTEPQAAQEEELKPSTELPTTTVEADVVEERQDLTKEKEELDQVKARITEIESATEEGQEVQESEAEELNTLKEKEKELESKISKPVEQPTELKSESKKEEVKTEKVKEKTEEEEADVLFNPSASFTSRVQFMSPEILMAKFGMSANQADAVMAKMQSEGVISEPDSTGKSQVLMKPYQVASIIDARRAKAKELAQKEEQKQKQEQERAQMTPEELAYEEKVDQVKGDIVNMDPTLNDSAVDTAARLFANGLTAKEAIKRAKAEQVQQRREQRKKATAASRVTLPRKGEAIGKPVGMAEAVNRLGQALKSTGINVRVIESQEEFNKLAKQYNLDPNKTEGFFVSKGENPQIIFNKKDLENKYGKTVLFHEGTHPIINIIRNTDPKAYNKLVKGLERLAEKNSQVKKVRDEIKKATTPESFEDEFIVESIAQIASGNIDPSKLDKGLRSSLINWMNKIAKMLGFGQIPINASTDEFVRLANQIKDVLGEGKDISEIVGKENVKTFQNKVAKSIISQASNTDFGKSRITKEPILDKDDFIQKLKSGQLNTKSPVEALGDNLFMLTFPDDLFVGSLFVDGKEIADLGGGVIYALVEGENGRMWASVSEKTAKSFAKNINKALKNSSDGIARVVLVKGSDIKHQSSLQAKVGFIKTLLNYAKGNNDFESELISAINEAYTIEKNNVDDLIEEFDSYMSETRSGTGQTMVDAAKSYESFRSALVKKSNSLLTDLGKKMGYGDEYFDSKLLKKSPPIYRAKNELVDKIFADIFQEDFLKGIPNGSAYAVLKVQSEVKPVKDKSHPSYPWVIRTVDNSPVTVDLFTHTFMVHGKNDALIGRELKPGQTESSSFGQTSYTAPKFKLKPNVDESFPGAVNLQDKLSQYKAIQPSTKIDRSNYAESKVFSGINQDISNAADAYKKQNGLSTKTPNFVLNVSEKDAKNIADAYDEMKHDPDNPEVKKGFEELVTQIKSQADMLLSMGYKFQLAKEGEGYGSSSKKMSDDVKNNKRILVDPSSKSFGTKRTFDKDNIGLQDSGYKDSNGIPMTNVELVRAVHDLFGHAEFGNGFGPTGEDNAWRNHMSMFTPLAQKALTTTTRGQNSWVNFGPHMRNSDGSIKKSGDPGYLTPDKRPFAEQKIGFLPDWAMENAYGDVVTINGRDIKPVNKYVLDGTEMYEIEDAAAFHDAIKDAKQARGADGIQVTLKSVDEYQKVLDNGGRLIVTKDGLAGLMIESNGNAGSGFSNPKIPSGQNSIKPLLMMAIKLGARFTDAYDTYLPGYYARFGFKVHKRLKFNPEYAEPGWENTTLSERPDVVVMYWDGGSREDIDKRYNTFPVYDKVKKEGSETKYTEDFDEAAEEARQISESIDKNASLVPPKVQPSTKIDRENEKIVEGEPISRRPMMDLGISPSKVNFLNIGEAKNVLWASTPKNIAEEGSSEKGLKWLKDKYAYILHNNDEFKDKTEELIRKIINVNQEIINGSFKGMKIKSIGDVKLLNDLVNEINDQEYTDSVNKLLDSFKDSSGTIDVKGKDNELTNEFMSLTAEYMSTKGMTKSATDEVGEQVRILGKKGTDISGGLKITQEFIDDFKKATADGRGEEFLRDAFNITDDSSYVHFSNTSPKEYADKNSIPYESKSIGGTPQDVQPSTNIDRDQSDKQNAIDKQFLESNGITDLDVNRWLSDNKFENLLDPKAREKFNKDFKVTLPPLQEIMNVDQLDTAIQSGIDGMGADLDQSVPFSQAFNANIKSKPWYEMLTDNQKAELENEARSIYAEEYEAESGQQVADTTPTDKASKLVDLWYKKKDRQRGADAEIKTILDSDEKLKYIWNNISPILRQLENKGILTKTAGCP